MLQVRLFSIMRQEIQFRKLQLAPYCKKNIESMVRHGIARMKMMDADKHPGHIMKAEQNLKALVVYLGEYARKAGTFPSLSESDYDNAMRNCPALWPYCSSG